MEAALGWLGDVVRAILMIVPRLLVIRSTHRGIRFRCGWKPLPMEPGLRIYWPVTTEIEVIPVKYRTLDLPQQYLETSDEYKVGLSGVVAYEITDVMKLVCECWDYEEVVKNHALAAIKEVVVSSDYEFCRGEPAEGQIAAALREDLQPFGIEVLSVLLSDFSEARMIAIWGISGG